LDTSFGRRGSGKVIQPIGSGIDRGFSLRIQPNGKILLGGYCYSGCNHLRCVNNSILTDSGGYCTNGTDHDFCIARFNFDGTLDTTFGSSGKVIQHIGSSDSYGYSLAIQIRR
jgi:uncharacterized delta-60 repeat protein